MDVLYAVDAYQDEMNSGFCKLDQRVMNVYNDYYSTMWCSVYAYIEHRKIIQIIKIVKLF